MAVVGFYVVGDPVGEGADIPGAGVIGVSDGSLDVLGLEI